MTAETPVVEKPKRGTSVGSPTRARFRNQRALAVLSLLVLFAGLIWMSMASLSAVPDVAPAEETPLVFSAERAMVDLLVLNRDNPRSLAWVAHTLRGRLAKLAGSEPNELSPMSLQVPNPSAWDLATLCAADPLTGEPTQNASPASLPLLQELLDQCWQAAHDVSERISATYFTHSGAAETSVVA